MRIFVTGGTGYIGKGVVKALAGAGHQVVGLVRSEEKARLMISLGGQPQQGDLSDPASFRAALERSEAAVHIAMDHSGDPAPRDLGVVEAFLAASRLPNGPKQLLYTSGVLVLGTVQGAPADERASTAKPFPLVTWRTQHERRVLEGAPEGVQSAVIRPGFVYGAEQGVLGFFQSAIERGAAEYIGDGQNHMAMVHHADIAQLYRMILEKRARGVFHGVDEVPARIIDMARAASEAAGAKGAVRSIPLEEARKKMGPWADAPCVDQRVACPRAHELGWRASRPVLPDGVAKAFQEWKASRG